MNLYTQNVDTSNRKPLVRALVELLAQPPVYSGPPFYAYKVGDYVVDRHGNVIVPDEASDETIQRLKEQLKEKGFDFDDTSEAQPEPSAESEFTEPVTESEPDDSDEVKSDEDNTESEAPEEESAKEETADESAESQETPEKPETPVDDKTHITLALPRFQFTPDAITRLKAIVQSKQTLLKKALDTDVLVIQLTDDKVLFPWFTDHGITGELDAYSKLVFAIARLAVNQRRASAEEKPNDNEKLAMRLFLIRLGFIGDEYKTARAILTRNFSGNSSWKHGPTGDSTGVELSTPEIFNPTLQPKNSQEDEDDK